MIGYVRMELMHGRGPAVLAISQLIEPRRGPWSIITAVTVHFPRVSPGAREGPHVPLDEFADGDVDVPAFGGGGEILVKVPPSLS